ncbi:hypothetical protein CP978_05810 [Streptomyces nodosus]|uniref:Uncharacterized protein n=1 Tax=Streptomyces nodosus TaxID=40318 RepID=A0A5P2W2P4_9ACTN|nr:hypothetical protein CP978_05810 [Streptomyces nodosus]
MRSAGVDRTRRGEAVLRKRCSQVVVVSLLGCGLVVRPAAAPLLLLSTQTVLALLFLGTEGFLCHVPEVA